MNQLVLIALAIGTWPLMSRTDASPVWKSAYSSKISPEEPDAESKNELVDEKR